MTEIRVGVYDSERVLREQRGPFEIPDVGMQTIPLDPPLSVPAGGMLLIALPSEARSVAAGPAEVDSVTVRDTRARWLA